VHADPDNIYVPDEYSTIQAAIDAANEEDTIIVHSGTYNESISIYKQLTIKGDDKENTIIDGRGNWASVTISADNVEFSSFTIINATSGIYLNAVDGTAIFDSIIYNCTESGIYVWNSDMVLIENSTCYGNGGDGIEIFSSKNVQIKNCHLYDNNENGIQLTNSIYSWTVDCRSYNNSNKGIDLLSSDYIYIIDCDSYNNSNFGVEVIYSDVVSIYNSTFNNNYYGFSVTNSDKIYISKSTLLENVKYGVSLYYSNGVILNSKIISNQVNGTYLYHSNVRIKYCYLENNNNYGVYSSGGTVNATECWWGDALGPFHPDKNPTGNGDKVSDNVEFDPWQTLPYQPETLISDLRYFILHAETNSTYYVPTGNIYDNSALYAFYASEDNPQIVITPTQKSGSTLYLDEDGRPVFTRDIVTFGGRIANRMVRYFEDAGIALVGYENNGTHHLFTRVSDGSPLYAVDLSTYNESERDYFVFQLYKYRENYVLSEWGISAEGTYAGGACFIDIILPNLASFTDGCVIMEWEDTNRDGSINNPNGGDSYTFITYNHVNEIKTPLEKTISRRMSIKTDYYSDTVVPWELVSKVLWAGYGFTPQGRTVPSLSGNNPILIYVCNKTAAYKYVPETQSLDIWAEGDYRGLSGGYLAPVQLYIVLDTNLCIDLHWGNAEAGCLMQNIYLMSNALDLGTVCEGGTWLDRNLIRQQLGLPENEEVLYKMPLGYPLPPFNEYQNLVPASRPNSPQLPEIKDSDVSLEEALNMISSSHTWNNDTITRQELSQILWASYGYSYYEDTSGVGNIKRHRTVPSAHAYYPMRIYVVDSSGIYEYLPYKHTITMIALGDKRTSIALASGNSWASSAPIIIVIVWDDTHILTVDTTYAEAGLVTQNIFLESAAWGLISDWGKADENEDEMRSALGLSGKPNLHPVSIITLGHIDETHTRAPNGGVNNPLTTPSYNSSEHSYWIYAGIIIITSLIVAIIWLTRR